MFEPGYSLFSA